MFVLRIDFRQKHLKGRENIYSKFYSPKYKNGFVLSVFEENGKRFKSIKGAKCALRLFEKEWFNIGRADLVGFEIYQSN